MPDLEIRVAMPDETEQSELGAMIKCEAEMLCVEDAASYSAAGALFQRIKTVTKQVEALFREPKQKASEAHKAVVAAEKKLLVPLKEAEAIVEPKMIQWRRDQDRIREEQEKKAREELAARMEKERAEEAARLQREADELAAAGKVAAAEEAQAAATEVAETPVYVPPVVVQSEVPIVRGVSGRKTWDFEIVDATKIPREFLMVDEQKIRGVVRAMKGQTQIPGVRAFESESLAFRK